MSLVWSWGHPLGCWGPRSNYAVYFETALVETQHFRQETATPPALGRRGSVGHAMIRIRLVPGRE